MNHKLARFSSRLIVFAGWITVLSLVLPSGQVARAQDSDSQNMASGDGSETDTNSSPIALSGCWRGTLENDTVFGSGTGTLFFNQRGKKLHALPTQSFDGGLETFDGLKGKIKGITFKVSTHFKQLGGGVCTESFHGTMTSTDQISGTYLQSPACFVFPDHDETGDFAFTFDPSGTAANCF
jgi:hypothetical protein